MSPARIHAWQMHRAASPPEPPTAPTFELRDEALPAPERTDGEALVRIAGCGVCGTDLGYLFDGIATVSAPPLTLGHEASGVVEEGPPEWLGARVLVPTILPCRRCELCAGGRANICQSQRMLGRSYGRQGAFASHVVVPAAELCRVPEGAPVELARLAVVTDAVATPYQACKRARVGAGDKVIVVGATGGLGLYAVQWAKVFGASLVIGVARSADRLAQLRPFGLDAAVPADADGAVVRRGVWAACKPLGVNPRHSWKILEMSGTEAGQKLALELLTYASTLVLVGYTPGALPFPLSKLMAFDAEVAGSWGCDPRRYPEVLAHVLDGRIQVGPFTELRPMSRIRETVAELRGARSSLRRIVLTPDWQDHGGR